MNELKLNEKLRLLAIKAILKLNQITHKNQLNSSKNAERFGPLENITKYLGAKKISLQLHERDEEKKAYILAIIQLLREYGIDIELIEFEQIFTNEDMRNIQEKNPDTIVTLRYMIDSYFTGWNEKMDYNIGEYCEVLDKTEYLCKITKANFKNSEEQAMFVITQLADYISYEKDYKSLPEEQFKQVSGLKGALLEGRTVCIGYAMALERCLTTLGIDCNIMWGIVRDTKPEYIPLILFSGDHAWNQVRLGDNWYNVDLTFFSSSKDLNHILVDDETFEGHYVTGGTKTFPCNSTYSRKQEIYDSIKNIKNVLAGYDLGKRDTILQYNLPSVRNKEVEEEKQIRVNDEINYGEEK